MSRKEIVGQQFTLAFGVDHHTGPFLQLWKNPAEDQDGAFIRVDNTGVMVDDDIDVSKDVNPETERYLNNLKDSFKKYPGRHIGEDHVITFAQLVGGFGDIVAVARAAYSAFD